MSEVEIPGESEQKHTGEIVRIAVRPLLMVVIRSQVRDRKPVISRFYLFKPASVKKVLLQLCSYSRIG